MAPVGHREAAVAPHRKATYVLKLARPLARATDDTHKLAVGSDGNDPTVHNIQHQQVAGSIEAHLQGRPEERPLPRVHAAHAVHLGHVYGQRSVLRDGRGGEQGRYDRVSGESHPSKVQCGRQPRPDQIMDVPRIPV